MNFASMDTRSGASRGAFLHLKHPGTGEPLYEDLPGEAGEIGGASPEPSREPVGIVLLGRDAPLVRERVRKALNARIRERERGETRTVEESVEEGLDLLVACTVEFRNIEDEGRPVTKERAREFYEKYDWVVEQATRFVNDRAPFLGN